MSTERAATALTPRRCRRQGWGADGSSVIHERPTPRRLGEADDVHQRPGCEGAGPVRGDREAVALSERAREVRALTAGRRRLEYPVGPGAQPRGQERRTAVRRAR